MSDTSSVADGEGGRGVGVAVGARPLPPPPPPPPPTRTGVGVGVGVAVGVGVGGASVVKSASELSLVSSLSAEQAASLYALKVYDVPGFKPLTPTEYPVISDEQVPGVGAFRL